MRLFARTSIVVVIGLSMTSCAFPNKRFTPPTQAASAPVQRTFNELEARINDGEAAAVCALYFWPSHQCPSIWRARLANMRRPVRLSVLKMTLGCAGDARVTYVERSPAGRRLRTLSVGNYRAAQ